MKRDIDDVKGEGLFYNYPCIYLPKNYSYSQMTEECWNKFIELGDDGVLTLFCKMIKTLSDNEEMQRVFGEPSLCYRFNFIRGVSSIVTYSKFAKYFNINRTVLYRALAKLEKHGMIKIKDNFILINPMFRTWSELCAKEVADEFGIIGEVAENSHWKNFDKKKPDYKKQEEEYKKKQEKKRNEKINYSRAF